MWRISQTSVNLGQTMIYFLSKVVPELNHETAVKLVGALVFCLEKISDLLWEKNYSRDWEKLLNSRLKDENVLNFCDHYINMIEQCT